MTNPYLELVQHDDDAESQALRSSLFAAQKSGPPAANARIVGTADATGLPVGVVQRNPSVIPESSPGPDPDELRRRSPGLASWYATPQNAMIAKGQHDAVQQVHDASVRLSAPSTDLFQPMSAMQADFADMRPITPDPTKGPEPLRAASLGMNDLLTGALGTYIAAGGPIDHTTAAQFLAERQQWAKKLNAAAPSYVTAYEQAKTAQAKRAQIYQALDLYHTGAGTLADALDMIATALVHPRGAASSMVRGTVASVPALVGGALGGPAGVGGGFALTSVGQDLTAQLEQRGVDVTDRNAVQAAFRDPALMASVRRKALASGLTSSSVMALTSALGARLLTQEVVSADGTVARVPRLSPLQTAVADAGVQSGSMAAGALAGQAASGEQLDPHAAMANAIAMLGFSAAHAATGLAAGATHAALADNAPVADPVERAAELHAETMDALVAIQNAQHLSDLHEGVTNAPHVAAVPARLRDLVAMVAGDGESSAAVHFTPEDWDAFYQSRNESPAEVAATVMGDDGKAYTEAKATGGTFAIPLADYAAKLATRPESEGLIPLARMRPDGPSLAEAQATLERLPDDMAALAAQAKAEAPADVSTSADAKQWGEQFTARMRGALEGAGRSVTEAKVGAELVRRFYETTAARMGTTPDVIAERYPLSVEAVKAATTAPEGRVLDEDGEARFPAARTLKGTLRDPASVATEPLFEEYARLIDANARDMGTYQEGQFARTDEYGSTITGSSRTAMRAKGRIAARDKAIARMQAEFARRGLDADAVNERWIAASERLAERDAITSEPAFASMDHPDEMLFQSMRPDMKLPDTDGTERFVDARDAAGTLRPLGDVMTDGLAAELADQRATLAEHPDDAAAKAQASAIEQELASRGLDPVDIDEHVQWASDREKVMLQGAETDARGAIHFSSTDATGEGFQSVIRLFQGGADRSTFFHEIGHFYTQMLTDLAARPDAPESIRADLAALREHVGAEGDTPFTRDQHETLARSFEAYLMEGRAPAPALRSAFRRLKAWLLDIYTSVKGLNVNLSPEVRSVFDRALASEKEIQSAERATAAVPLFRDTALDDLTPEQRQRYEELVAGAHDAWTEALTKMAMAKLLREGTADWKRLREAGREDVEALVNADRTQRAVALLTKGTEPDGSPLEDGVRAFKLDAAATKDYLGGRDLPKGATTTEGGVDPDVAASMLGFDSGLDLVDALVTAPRRKALIERLLDERVQERHGEQPADPEAFREEAERLVREKQRSQVIREELRLLASHSAKDAQTPAAKIGRPIPSVESIRAEAEKQVGAKTLRDLRPDVLKAAATKASRAAADAYAKGDRDAAFSHKLQELFATEMFRAASDARAEVKDALQSFKPIFRSDKTLAKGREMGLVNAARAVLAAFHLGPASDEPAWRYLDTIRTHDPETGAALTQLVEGALASVGRADGTDYRTLTLDQFRLMHTAVDALWTQARRSELMRHEGELIDRKSVVAELRQRIATRIPEGARPGEKEAASDTQKRVVAANGVSTILRRVEHWVRDIDGGDPNGPFRRYLSNPIIEAQTRYQLAMAGALDEYRQIVADFAPAMDSRKIPAPELGYTFKGKNELLGALLHTGNASNLQKLLRGRGWGDFGEHRVLDTSKWDAFIARMQRTGTLTKADYDFVQRVWDMFEARKGEAQRAHHAVYGYYFDEIDHQPFATPFGSYQGGYYPAKADPWMLPSSERQSEATALLEADNVRAPAKVGDGFTKSRVEQSARPLIMDASMVPAHLATQLKFIHLAEPVVDAARLLRDRDLTSALDAMDRHAVGELLNPWLARVAQQKTVGVGQSKYVDAALSAIRQNAGMQILAGNLTTAVEQLTHMPSLAVRVDPSSIASALDRMTRHPVETAQFVAEKSDYMRTRSSAGLMEGRQAIERILLDPSKLQQAGAWVREHGMALSRGIQWTEDHIAWMGAYADAVKQGMEDRDAVRHADATVREVMGAFDAASLSRFEAGTPLAKLFTMFSSFFVTKANMLKTDVSTTLRSDLGFTSKARHMAAIYAFGFMIPAVLAATLKSAVNGQPIIDKDGDGTDWSDFFRWYFGSQLDTGVRMLPVVGPLAQTAITGKPIDVVSSPAIALGQQALKVPHDAVDAIRDKLTRGHITDFFTLLGLATGAPLRPLSKPIGYEHDVQTGQITPANPLDHVRGLLTGTAH